jgi:glycosyltransferase involved in cell wall biosynthesis
MNKICFLTPTTFKNEGSTTHIIEVWKRVPKFINAEIFIMIIKGKNDKRILNIKKVNILEIPPLFSNIKYNFIKGIIYQYYALKYCLSLKNLKLIYSRYTAINFADIILSKLKQIPLIVEVNGIYRDEIEGKKFHTLKIFLNRILMKKLFSSSEKIITVTSNLKDFLILNYNISPNKIEVIYNGVDPKLFKPIDKNMCRKKLKINNNSNVICFVGSLTFWHGIDYLIESAPKVLNEFSDTIFLIVGGGALEKKLKNKVKKLNIKGKFIFTGWISYDQVPVYINSSDICVIPCTKTRNNETGSSAAKLYEYLACNKPVIGSNINGIGDILIKYNVGIPVIPENSQDLSDAIIELLSNESLRKQKGNNGRKTIINKYTWEINAKKVGKICRKYM